MGKVISGYVIPDKSMQQINYAGSCTSLDVCPYHTLHFTTHAIHRRTKTYPGML